mgnify:CR=1 FL=1
MSFAILATVAFAIVFAFAFSANSFNLAGRIEMFYLHPSNVNVVEELVAMIQTQRAYEMSSKAISTVDQMLQNTTQNL